MKRNLFSWLLLVVFSLIFVASSSHADVVAIRSVLGLSADKVSSRTPAAQFAVDRPHDTPRPFSTDEIVGNLADDAFVLLPPALQETLVELPSSGGFTMLLVVFAKGNVRESSTWTGIAPIEFLRSVTGLAKDLATKTIVLEVRVPASLPPQTPQDRAAGGGLRFISPEPASFQSGREPMSVQDYAVPLEISRARGPVK